MNSFVIAALFATLALSNAAPSTRIIQGPSTRTTVVGPDGSAISSVAPGGQIITEDHQGLVAQTAPLYAAPAVAYSQSYAAPALTYAAAPALSYATAPSLYTHGGYAAPLAYAAQGYVAQNQLDTLVAGPSGTIATTKTVAAPALYSHSAPLTYTYGAHHGLYL